MELNATFTNFVNFANQAIQAGNKDAVARVAQPEGKFTLGTGRTVTASQRGDAGFDKTFALFRSDEAKSANETARAVFKTAIGDIFGGEKNIPESVKKQMTNFGTDKPLSARRIMLISQAVTEAVSAQKEKVFLDAGDAMINDIKDTLKQLKETKGVPASFIKQAAEKYDSAIAEIRKAQADLVKGDITETDFSGQLATARSTATKATTDRALMKPILDQNREVYNAIKKISDGNIKKMDKDHSVQLDVLVTSKATKALEEVRQVLGDNELPEDIFECLKNSIKSDNLEGKRVQNLIKALKDSPESFKPTADQMKRIAKFTSSDEGAKMVAKAFSNQRFYELLTNNGSDDSIEKKIKAFEENGAELASFLKIGFKQELTEKEIFEEIGKQIEANFQKANQSDKLASFDDNGIFQQSIRETNGGTLTFDGEKIPDYPSEDGKKKFSYYNTFGSRAIAYAETLMTKFDDEHVGMRKLVSLMSSMADGINGVIDEAFNMPEGSKLTNERDNKLLVGMKTDSNIASGGKSRDKNEITFDQNGDVYMKCTRYQTNELWRVRGVDCGKQANGRGCTIAETKFEVTVKIPRQSDKELNGKMPKFEVIGFSQQPM